MATLANTHLTLSDYFKTVDGAGNIASIIEVLNQSQEVTKDIPWIEANNGMTHRHTIRTGLPSVTWGELYKGVPQSKSDKQSVEDATGMLEAGSQVDVRLLELAPNAEAFRASEARPHIEAMGQECATALFYHSHATDPKKPTGLAARFNTLGTVGASAQIIDAGGVGSDNTSIWFVTWGENSVHGIYPKGSRAGLQQTDEGKQRVTDADGNPYFVKEETFRWHLGFAVRDWRNVARIANVDVSNMQAGSVDLYSFMRKAYYKLHTRRVGKVEGQVSPGRTVIYCNRDVLEALDGLATNTGASDNFVRLRPMEIQGEEVLTYRGIPIRETDALLNTEAAVS